MQQQSQEEDETSGIDDVIDYNAVDEIMNKEREKSLEWFQDSLLD